MADMKTHIVYLFILQIIILNIINQIDISPVMFQCILTNKTFLFDGAFSIYLI